MPSAWLVPVREDRGTEWRESRWKVERAGKPVPCLASLRGQKPFLTIFPGSVPVTGEGGPQEELLAARSHCERVRVPKAEDRRLRWD